MRKHVILKDKNMSIIIPKTKKECCALLDDNKLIINSSTNTKYENDTPKDICHNSASFRDVL